MQTPLILKSTNALQPATPPARQGTDASSANQFNQVLSRQIKDRPHSAENKPPVHGKDNATPAKAASNSSKSVAKHSGDKEKATDASDDDSDEKVEALPAAPTELMALVAQAAQFGQAVAKAANSGTSPHEQTEAAIGLDEAAKNPAAQLRPADSTEQFEVPLVADTGNKNERFANQVAKQNDLLSNPAQETLAALSINEKKQEILPELATSAKAPEALSNLAMTQAHPIPLDALAAAGGRPTEKLSPHVGTPAWDQALGQKIVWMVGGAQQSASLTLNPPDLGPLQVVLNVSNEQASATFISAQPEVRQAIEAALPKLREMMGEAGIQLGQTNINAGSGGQQEQPGEQNRSSPASFGHAKNPIDTPASGAVSVGTRTTQGLVNTFA